MFHVVLYQPRIPPNTGNVIRLCANTGTRLHLIRPLGFALDDAKLRRAGLDYREWAEIDTHDSLEACRESLGDARLFALTTKARRWYSGVQFRSGDAFLFGPEPEGLPIEVLEALDENHCLRLPMVPGNRSVNLSNAVAVVIYEAWRQIGFEGGK
jgi:tRNA (cytidine/uridine-2'-O-)-methyltransferase